MNMMQDIMETLRSLLNSQCWCYCVMWKLCDDKRSIELVSCCCAGTANAQNKQHHVSDSQGLLVPCRDMSSQHPRTTACDLLDQLPCSMPLNSGIYAQTFLSNQPSWSNFPKILDSDIFNENCWIRYIVPLPGGLIELVAQNQVGQDQVLDLITSQVSIGMEQASVINLSNMDMSFKSANASMNDLEAKPNSGMESNQDNDNHFYTPQPLSEAETLQDFQYDISADHNGVCRSNMNLLQQYNCSSEDKMGSDIFNGVSHHTFNADHDASNTYKYSLENALQEMDAMQNTMMNNELSIHAQYGEYFADKEQEGNKKSSIRQEIGHSDSISDCSDQVDDTDYSKSRNNGKEPQSKNLEAERKRRKKLNERLLTLRALVPNISKLDRASILGDAIEYVKQLQNQVKELQDELEEDSNNEGTWKNHKTQSEILNQNGLRSKFEDDSPPNEIPEGALSNGCIDYSKQCQESEITMEKCQQMEPQVEVAQMNGNDFFIKVFYEHKAGGFARLMEALNSYGLEVTNANVTRFRSLVLSVFEVKQKKECEYVQADHVRDSLLEVTRNPSNGWIFETSKGPKKRVTWNTIPTIITI